VARHRNLPRRERRVVSDLMSADDDRSPNTTQQSMRPLVRWDELLATCVASAIAAAILSRLGVAGTIVGAAATPFIMTIGSAALARQIARARQHIVAAPRGRRPSGFLATRLSDRRRLASALATGALAFVSTAALITVVEAFTGKPIDRWGHAGGKGYTFRGDSSRVTGVGVPRDTATPATTPTTPTTTSPTGPAGPRPQSTVTTHTVTVTVPKPAVPTQSPTVPPPSPTAAPTSPTTPFAPAPSPTSPTSSTSP
jgi:hypothetical protein